MNIEHHEEDEDGCSEESDECAPWNVSPFPLL